MRRAGSAIVGNPDASIAAARGGRRGARRDGRASARTPRCSSRSAPTSISSAPAAAASRGSRHPRRRERPGPRRPGRRREDEIGPAVAVLALADVGPRRSASPEPGAEDAIGSEVEAQLGRSPTETDLVVVFADPLGMRRDAARRRPRRSAARDRRGRRRGARRGAIARCSRAPIAPCAAALCGLVLSLDAPARVAVSQGCRPITDPIAVDARRGQLDPRARRQAGARRLPRDRARAAGGGSAPRRRARARGAAAQRAPSRRQRRRLGRAPRRRLRARAPRLRAARAAARRHRACVSRCATPISPARIWRARSPASRGPASAGLYLSSSARGRALFRHRGLESAIVARALAPAPLAGLFGSFEIAPLAGSPGTARPRRRPRRDLSCLGDVPAALPFLPSGTSPRQRPFVRFGIEEGAACVGPRRSFPRCATTRPTPRR